MAADPCGSQRFSLNEEDFTVVHSQWHIFRKNPSQETKVRLLAVTYEGVLTVTDTELFCKALTEGIGRGKAYGMGLLTVAKVASMKGKKYQVWFVPTCRLCPKSAIE